MLTITVRPYAGAKDLEPIANLFNLCDAADRFDNWTTVTELQEDFTEPNLDPQRDIRIWENSEGELIAFASLWISEANQDNIVDGYLWFRVHPAIRKSDRTHEAIAWAEKRLREVAISRHVQVNLRVSLRSTQQDLQAILQSCGLRCDRYFYRMARSLLLPIPQPQLPQGFTLRAVRGESEIEAWVDLFNDSFIDHWNHHPLTVERWQPELRSLHYRPELDLVAVADSGTLAAFCHCTIYPEHNQAKGRKEGWIGELGTRRGFRRRGLGRAMLLAGMHQLKAVGMDTALLGVDTTNPSGALKLYESVGFSQVLTHHIFVKAL
ncbi:MAG: GNAT family N-acetyltransferase [Desertifilum sp.]|nr:GNAT family N-acetyltransferase [Desertifilum sp.]